MSRSPVHTIRLSSFSGLECHNASAEPVSYRGRRCVKLIEHSGETSAGGGLAIIPGVAFRDGVIRAKIAGTPHADALDFSRGFVGIAFRVQPNGSAFECFFLRPLNARADDQLRRNHSTQYMSHPDFPWDRLRRESPGVYESYADLASGKWSKIEIVVSGVRAQLYVNDSEQPCLVVNDLKLGETKGEIGLWVGSGTDAYFSEVAVR